MRAASEAGRERDAALAAKKRAALLGSIARLGGRAAE